MKKLLFTLSLSVLSIVCVKAQDFVLKGTIGKYPVVMELNIVRCSDYSYAHLKGSYYYESQGPSKRLDIDLMYKAGGHWEMKEYDGPKMNGSFEIKVPTFRKGDIWTGTYKTNDKTYDYTLKMSKVAQDAVFHYKGKIGKYPIVMEILNLNYQCDKKYFDYYECGNYYYVSQGPFKRIIIEGQGAAVGTAFCSEYIDGNEVGTFYHNASGSFYRAQDGTEYKYEVWPEE